MDLQATRDHTQNVLRFGGSAADDNFLLRGGERDAVLHRGARLPQAGKMYSRR